MSLRRFCRKDLVTLRPDEPALKAAEHMREHHVGAVVVLNAEDRPVGIITDRDLVCRVMAVGRDPSRALVREVMSASASVIDEGATIDEALVQMRELGARRLPIVDGTGALVGLLSLDDALVMLSAELGQMAAVVRKNRGP